jgi:hypothetical protein
MESIELNLRTLDQHPAFFESARKAWEKRDVERIMCYMPNTRCLAFVADNILPLTRAGKYEEALVSAYKGTRGNFSNWSLDFLMWLFELADCEKLRSVGSPIPPGESFTLYRGVSGKGRARRVNGLSWTESPSTAAWFACRFPDLGDPAVFRVTVPREQILFYSGERSEKEYVLQLPLSIKPKRVQPMPCPCKPFDPKEALWLSQEISRKTKLRLLKNTDFNNRLARFTDKKEMLDFIKELDKRN